MSERNFTRLVTREEFDAVIDELRIPLARIREIVEENDLHVLFADYVRSCCDMLESGLDSDFYRPKH